VAWCDVRKHEKSAVYGILAVKKVRGLGGAATGDVRMLLLVSSSY